MPFPAVPEFKPLRRLTTPAKVQDFLDRIPINKERHRETCMSPLMALRRNKAHCLEGALIAALALWMQGRKPLLMDLQTTDDDVDHVCALFNDGRHWGAITKTNHAVLRYREPIHRDLRELATSYFHEYFTHAGKKTLRRYSSPFDLRAWGGDWMTSTHDLWDLEKALDRSPHHDLMSPSQIRRLRKADDVEIKAGRITEW